MLTKGAIGNLINRYKAVLAKCNLINTFGSLAVASMLVLGGAGVAGATDYSNTANLPIEDGQTYSDVHVHFDTHGHIYGGVTNLSGTNNIDGCTFSNNSIIMYDDDGQNSGGVAFYNSGTTSITNSKFHNNVIKAADNYTPQRTNKGGAVWNNAGGSLNITGSTSDSVDSPTFYKNQNLIGDGGAITSISSNSLNLSNAFFVENSANNGGAVYVRDGISTFKGNTFKGNSSVGRGGALWFGYDAEALFEGKNTFKNNVSQDRGGALNANWQEGGSKITFKDGSSTLFSGNTAINGGAISIDKGSSVLAESGSALRFESNSANTDGGAIYNEGTATFTIAGNAEFTGNTANGTPNDIYNAGTINVLGGTTTIGGGITGDGDVNVQNGTLKFLADEAVESFSNDNTFTIGNGSAESSATVELASDATFSKAIVGKGVISVDADTDALSVSGATIALADGVEFAVAVEEQEHAITGNLAIDGEGKVIFTGFDDSNIRGGGSILGTSSNVAIDVAELVIGHEKIDGRTALGNIYGINQISGRTELTADKITITGVNGGAGIYTSAENTAVVNINGFKDNLTIRNISDGSDYGYAIINNHSIKNTKEIKSIIDIDGEGNIDIIGTTRSAIVSTGDVSTTNIKTSKGDILIKTAGITKANADENLRKGSTIYAAGGDINIEASAGNINIKAVADRTSVASDTVGNRALGIATGGVLTLKAGSAITIDGDIADANDEANSTSTDTGKLILAGGTLNVTDGTVDGFTGITSIEGDANVTLNNTIGVFGGQIDVKGGSLAFDESLGDVSKAFTVYNVAGSKVDTSAVNLVGDASATGQYVIHVSGTTVDDKLEQNAVINNSALTEAASVKIGSVSVDTDGVIVIDKAIIHNVADKDTDDSYPAVIHNAGGAISITNSEFKNNKDSTSTTHRYAYGSVIYGDENSSLNISNSLFEGNEVASSYNGDGGKRSYGTIHHSGDLTITDSQFKDNISDYMCGVLRASSGTFTGNTFEGNKANGGAGGAIYLSGSATFTGNTFTKNYSASEGGAISLENDKAKATTVSFLGTNTFTGNDANTTGAGGALYIHNTDDVDTLTVNIEGQASFSTNTAESGGAIYNKSLLNIDGATFTGNTAGYGGGAIYSTGGGELTVENSTFTGNKASIGGAIVEGMKAEKTTIGGSTFTGNIAYSDGGALSLNGPETILTDSTFTDNIAGFENGDVTGSTTAKSDGGGAVFVGGTTHVTMTDVEFTDNISAVRGGAISARHGKDYTLTIKGDDKTVLFSGNKAGTFGGAIANVYGGTVDVANAQFTGNTAEKSGGAIYNGSDINYGFGGDAGVQSTNHGIINLTDVTFSGNKANKLGGAIYNDAYGNGHGTINFDGENTFSENSDSKGANDIYNAGIVNVNSGTTTLKSGYAQAEGAQLNITGKDATLVVDFGSIMDDYENKVVDINGTDGTLNLVLGDTQKYSASDVALTKNALFGDAENAQLNFVGGVLVKGDDDNLIASGAIDNNKEMTISSTPVVAIEGQQTFEQASELKQHISSLEEMLKIVDDSPAHDLADVDSVKFDLAGKDKKLTVQGIQTLADKISVEEGTELSLYGTYGKGLVTDGNDSASAADMLVKGKLNLGVDGADAMAGILGNVDVDGGALNIVKGFDLTAGSLTVQNQGELTADELEAKNLAVKNQGKLTAKALKADGLDVQDAELSADKLTTSGDSKIMASELGKTTLKVKELIAEAGTLAMDKIKTAFDSFTVDKAEVAVTDSELEVGSFTVVEGDVSIKGSNLEIGTLAAKGGSIFIDPTNLTVADLAGDLNSDFYIGEDSTVTLGTYDLSKAPAATATLAIGAGKSIHIGTGSLVVDGKLTSKPATALADGSASFSAGSLLAVDAADAVQGKAALTGAGKLTVEEGAKLYLSDSAANKTYTIAQFKEADVKGWQQNDDTLSDGSTAPETITNKLLTATTEVADGVVTVKTAKDVDSEFFTEGLPVNALNELADKGGRVDDASMGKKFLSRATDGGSQYVAAGTDTVGTINEVSRAAVTAGVQNTSLRIADAASNTVVDHMSLSQHGASSSIHSDGVDFWAAPMYGNLYTSGMNVAGSSVRGQFGGLALGADLEAGQFLGGKFRLGAAINGGGGQSETKGSATSTQNDYDFGGLNFYAGWNSGALNIIGSVGYGFGNHEVEMGLPVAGMNSAKADVDTTVFTADLRAEYQLKTDWVDILPHAGIRYTALKTDAHDLKSNGSVLNSVKSDTQNIVQFPVGVTISKDFDLSGWNVKPMADISVIPAAGEKKATTKVNFSGMDAWDSVNSRIMDSTSWAGTVGVQAEKGNFTLGLNYGVQASSNETDQNIQVKFGWKF